MERDADLTKKIRRKCKKFGADIIGIADPKYFDRYPKKNQPENFLKDSRSVVILGLHINDIFLDAYYQDKKGYFHFADSILETICCKLKDLLMKEGFTSEIITYNPGFYLKEISALAGIGSIGKNNLLITEEFGSQVRLRALTTTAPLVCGEPILESEYCKDCDLCMKACPADAFSEGTYNREKCLSYNLSNLKKISDNIEIWCNVCIEACPMSEKALKK
ncbi:MAG: epoxyqueuosine reductase [Promethearchaeota archaeon]|nr:MAG: epoxyqueuosine reductase [Candidatus Lokiarchaeota archaeon]